MQATRETRRTCEMALCREGVRSIRSELGVCKRVGRRQLLGVTKRRGGGSVLVNITATAACDAAPQCAA